MMPLSLGNTILLKEKGGMRESIPRQIKIMDSPRRRKGSGALKEKRTNIFSYTDLS